MNHRSVGALIALNIALLAALVVAVWGGAADAANRAGAAAAGTPGDYLMITGDDQGTPPRQPVYVLDLQSKRIAVLMVPGSGQGAPEEVVGVDLVPILSKPAP